VKRRRDGVGDGRQLDLFDPPFPPPASSAGVTAATWPEVTPAAETSVAPVIAFPSQHRIGKIRDVAAKILATKSAKHANYYRDQVGAAMAANLRSKRVAEAAIGGEISRFWRAVDLELARLTHGGRRRG
jgi:hypothetical protein